MLLNTWNIRGGPYHFGRRGLGQETSGSHFPSDSLYAALLALLARIQGAAGAEALGAALASESPPFALTSAFPRAGAVRFFPAPLGRARESAVTAAKALKKVRYLSETAFREALAGRPLADIYAESLHLQGGAALVSPADRNMLPKDLPIQNEIWKITRRARVTIHRQLDRQDEKEKGSNLFFTGEVWFASDCGLWFGVRELPNGRSWLKEFPSLLNALAESGLGAERAAGLGACTIEEAGEGIELPDPSGRPWLALSRYLPRADETNALLHPSAAYALETASGWVDSPSRSGQRRRPVNLLAEGSILGPVGRETPGAAVDIRPRYPADPDPLGHPVIRCGVTVAVGITGGLP